MTSRATERTELTKLDEPEEENVHGQVHQEFADLQTSWRQEERLVDDGKLDLLQETLVVSSGARPVAGSGSGHFGAGRSGRFGGQLH